MKTIFLDPGHGGQDPGAVGYGLQEKNLNLRVARYCEDYLNAHYSGHRVVSSRDGDRQVLLQDIVKKARAVNADVLVSIHTNAARGTGYESFLQLYPSQEETRLQRVLHKEVYSSAYKEKFPDRGMKKGSYYVLRNSHCPAILSENLFIDTKKDVEFLKVESNLRTIGEAHAKGIAKFLDLPRKQVAPKAPVASNATKLKRIQVAAYRTEKEAKDFEKKLNQKGFKDTSVKYEEDNYYHVYAGTYSQQRYLDEHVRKLNNAGFDTYVVDYHRVHNTVQSPNKQPAKVVQVFGVGDKIKIKRGAKDLNSERTYANFVYDTTYQVLDVGSDWISFGPKPYQYTGKVSKSNVERA